MLPRPSLSSASSVARASPAPAVPQANPALAPLSAMPQPTRQASSGAQAQLSSPNAAQLLVYVDSEKFPEKLSCELTDLRSLIEQLQRIARRPIAAVSVWDEDFRQYIPIRSVDPIRVAGRAKLWVETGGVRLVQVEEGRDPLEYAALREHVDKLSPPRDGYVFEMTDAHRIIHPELDQRFAIRRKRLLDNQVRTLMLFYTNNARPSEQVVQHGFSLPTTNDPKNGGGGIIFASDIDAQPSLNANLKFLLCEVAVGRSFTIHTGDKLPANRPFDSANYDSLLSLTARPNGLPRLEEWVVFDPDQAVPRYIVTCSIVRGNLKTAWNPVAMGCDQHPGEALKLWCATCRKLICPYCLTIGAHKGHDGRDTAEVALFERQVVQKMHNTLDNNIIRRQGEVAEMEKAKSLLMVVAKKGEEEIGRAMHDLHQLLDNEERQLLANLDAKKNNCISHVDRGLTTAQQTCADLQKKLAEVKQFLCFPIETSQQARMEFLARLATVFELLHAAPSYDDNTPADMSVPELHTALATDEVKTAIQSLSLVDARTAGQGSTAVASSVSRVALDAELSRLRDLECGYLWVIPNAAQHMAPNQTKDIFSDVFQLLGVSWEVRVSPQPEGHVSVFVHASGHTQRMDFKVIVFSSKGWYVRSAKNWLDSFRGRGWGIKPFCEKEVMLNTYVADGVLKVCITPTSGLY